MFDIGFFELLLIGIVTLVVVGPERLPEVAKTAGVYVAKFRRFVAGVRSDIDKELESGELKKILGDQRDQIRELKDIVDTTRREIETTTTSAMKSANEFSTSMEDKYTSLGSTENTSSDDDSAKDKSPEESKDSSTANTAEQKPVTPSTSDADDKPGSSTDQSSGNAKTG